MMPPAAAPVATLATAVLDAGGHPVAFARQDGASPFRHDIARPTSLRAIGVSGDTPDIDAACARAGVAAFHGDR